MKFTKFLTLGIFASSIIGCSSINSDNYVQKTNQPQIQGGDTADRAAIKLNPTAWNNLDVTKNTADVRVTKDGERVVGNETSYLLLRANVVNNGDQAAEVKWRCKFYLANNIPLGDSENNKVATDETGLGWHTMIVYPVKSKAMVDDANVIMCVSPYTKATSGKIEVHDMSNDVTIYNK